MCCSAGTETTAFSLTHMMMALAAQPELVERLKREQQQLVQQHGETITSASHMNCLYS